MTAIRRIDVAGQELWVGRSLLRNLAALEAGPVAVAEYLPHLQRASVRLYLSDLCLQGLAARLEPQHALSYELTPFGRDVLRALREP